MRVLFATDHRIAALGAISGALSAMVYALPQLLPVAFTYPGPLYLCLGSSEGWGCYDFDLWTAFAPGLIFGVIVGAGLWRWYGLTLPRLFFFVLLSAFAYVVARHAAEYLMSPLLALLEILQLKATSRLDQAVAYALYALNGGLSGAVGAAILAVSCMWLGVIDRWRLLVWTGAITGMLLTLYSTRLVPISVATWMFFVLWQTAYAWTLAAVAQTPRRRVNAPTVSPPVIAPLAVGESIRG